MSDQIDTLLNEQRRFPPPAAFTAKAVGNGELHAQVSTDPEAFWEEQAR
ncbi:MAG: hypothetical protein JF590_01275, partial [Gemmatimonadetes bacterium]|nr:hypothetical protein [Gemmatimonadota bacterium]